MQPWPLLHEPAMATTTDPVAMTLDLPGNHAPARRWLRPGWPLYVLLTLLFGLYLGLNHAIGMRSTDVAAWKPFLWELSSVIVIAPLIPLIGRFENRLRIDSRPRMRALLAHIAGSVVFSIVHTTGMVLIRKLVSALAGDSYNFGNILLEWFYELQKDLITYFIIL